VRMIVRRIMATRLLVWICGLCVWMAARPAQCFLNTRVAPLRLVRAPLAPSSICNVFTPVARGARAGQVSIIRMSSSPDDQFDDASMEAFRALMKNSWDGSEFPEEDCNKEFDGYQFRDLIVDKWGVPYDIQIKREMFLGKPMIFLNVMWKYLGQQSFHLDEQEYLEHLQAIAELCVKWERVDHLKDLVKECRKRPKAYEGFAVALPLNLPADVMDELNIPESQ